MSLVRRRHIDFEAKINFSLNIDCIGDFLVEILTSPQIRENYVELQILRAAVESSP